MITAAQWTFAKTQCLNVGNPGPTGPTGPTGPMGAAGSDGISYGTGPIGQSGPSGSSGPAGPNGANGSDGLDRTTPLDTRTRSFQISNGSTQVIPINLVDVYQTILLAPLGDCTIILNPDDLQRTGIVPNFWVILKNASRFNIAVNPRTFFRSSGLPPDVGAPSSSALTISGGDGVDITGSSVILYYDITSKFGLGNGAFILI